MLPTMFIFVTNVLLTTYLWPNSPDKRDLDAGVGGHGGGLDGGHGGGLDGGYGAVILMVLDDETFIGEILWRRVEARQVAGES